MASRGRGAVNRGKVWERDIVHQGNHWDFELERIQAGFHEDKGDLAGMPLMMIEAKAAATTKIGEGMDKMAESLKHSDKQWAVMLQKRPNHPPSEGWAIMTIDEWFSFMEYLRDKGALE